MSINLDLLFCYLQKTHVSVSTSTGADYSGDVCRDVCGILRKSADLSAVLCFPGVNQPLIGC